jgi:hypothetical protein
MEYSDSQLSHAKLLDELAAYHVIPSRFLYPEEFQYPINSLESKKSLLLSMSPVISTAEIQRKIDSDAVESFTRCKVGKASGRGSSYEYMDIDTKVVVSPDEYKRR